MPSSADTLDERLHCLRFDPALHNHVGQHGATADTLRQHRVIDFPCQSVYSPDTMSRAGLNLTPAPAGWVHADWGSGRAWIRFGRDEHDKLTRITEVHVSGEPTAESLRQIPLARIATAVRANGQVQVMLAIGINGKLPPEYLSAPPEKFGELVEKHKPRYRLKRPSSRRLGDAFFKNVARAYLDAAGRGLNPRQTLAQDAGVPVDTVARWIREARAPERRYLPPGQPGKVTAEDLADLPVAGEADDV
jgi:hypothetical protein